MSEQAAEQAEADFAAVLAEVSAEAPDEHETEPTVQNADTPDESEDADEPDAKSDEPELSEAETEAAKLIEAGELDAALKRLGVNPSVVKTDRRQFFAMRKGLADAKAKLAESEKGKADAVRLKTEAEKLYGPIAAGFRAMQSRDGAKLRAAIELLAEDSLENVLAVVQSANRPLDPATAEVLRLRQELAERDKAAKAEQAKAGAAQAEKAQVAKLEAQVAKTPLAKVPGAAQRIYERVKASYDGVGYSVTVQQAYREELAAARVVASAFGAAPPAKPGKAPLPERRAPSSADRKLSREEREAEEFRRTIAEAEAAARSVERAVRRRSR